MSRVCRESRVKQNWSQEVEEDAHQKQMEKSGQIGEHQPQRQRNPVGLVDLSDIAAVDFHQGGRQADERAHGPSKDRHGREECLLCPWKDGGKDAAHHDEKQQGHQVAGDEQCFASQVQLPLEGQSVEKCVH